MEESMRTRRWESQMVATGSPLPETVTGKGREYRVDELAQVAGTTVRNIRAYQDRGLLAPPRRLGRVGLYSEAHLARLRLLGALLDRGYSLANIAELLGAWEQGQDVAAVLGLEAALSAPWADRPVQFVTVAELVEAFGERATPLLSEAVDLGLLVAEDRDRYRVANPAALEVGRLLVAAGVPLEAVLSTAGRLRSDVDDIARRFVGLVQTHVVGPPGAPLDGVELRG
ncbi:MAG: MerR family transcriptional regulator, partial [Acidimicrobiales bacterium]